MAMPAAYAIRLEVIAIDSEDSPGVQRFGGSMSDASAKSIG